MKFNGDWASLGVSYGVLFDHDLESSTAISEADPIDFGHLMTGGLLYSFGCCGPLTGDCPTEISRPAICGSDA